MGLLKLLNEVMYISLRLMAATYVVFLLKTHGSSQNQEPDLGKAKTKKRAMDFMF